VEEVGRKPAQCIAVDSPRHLYVTDGFIVTHNTITGTAVLEVLAAKGHDPYPAVVICPSHLVEKWVREIEKTIPDARAIIVERLPDVVRFANVYETGKLPHKSVIIMSKEMAKLGPGWEAAVLPKKVRIKRAGGRVRVVTHYHCPKCGAVQTDDEGLPIVKHERFTKRRRFCRVCGQALHQYSPGGSSYRAYLGWQATRILQDLQAEQLANRSTEGTRAKVETPETPADAESRAMIVELLGKLGCSEDRAGAVLTARGFPALDELTTTQAREVLFRLDVAVAKQQTARAEAELSKWSPKMFLRALRESEVAIDSPDDVDQSTWSQDLIDALKAAKPVERVMPEVQRLRRWALADYIRRYLDGFFGLLIGDEVHQYKGKSTDQGKAFDHLVNAMRVGALGLTGTLFGGKSTDLFWLLYRLNPKLRHHYGFSDEKRWAEHYGRLEKVTKTEVAEEDGSFSGTTRRYNRAKELPGISPGIVRWVLPTITFLRLPDLGFPLPPLREEVVRLNMADAQADQYDELYDELYELMKEALKNGDNRLVSVWLTNVLCRPNSAFREEWVVQYRGTEKEEYVLDYSLPPVVKPGEWLDGPCEPLKDKDDNVVELPRLLPKEQWLVDYVRSEVSQGRKCIVYLQQTSIRDIQPRYKEILQEAGIRTTILPSSVTAKKREKWIQKKVDQMDVLICHPKLVETGLDLIEFSTVIFAEMQYSLYTLWQAARRVYRLTQTKPVKIVYAVYRDTMEEMALALMGAKLKAAQQLYGDEVGGALVQTDDGDFLEELARRVMTGKELPDLESLFAVENAKVTSPMGSIAQPGMELPAQPTVQELEAKIVQIYGQAALRSMQRRRPRKPKVSEDHPTLFDLDQFEKAA
jgi:superfamily II DNA or RNA helicase